MVEEVHEAEGLRPALEGVFQIVRQRVGEEGQPGGVEEVRGDTGLAEEDVGEGGLAEQPVGQELCHLLVVH